MSTYQLNISKDMLQNAITSYRAQLNRKKNSESNTLIKQIVDKDIVELDEAWKTITEVKTLNQENKTSK